MTDMRDYLQKYYTKINKNEMVTSEITSMHKKDDKYSYTTSIFEQADSVSIKSVFITSGLDSAGPIHSNPCVPSSVEISVSKASGMLSAYLIDGINVITPIPISETKDRYSNICNMQCYYIPCIF